MVSNKSPKASLWPNWEVWTAQVEYNVDKNLAGPSGSEEQNITRSQLRVMFLGA